MDGSVGGIVSVLISGLDGSKGPSDSPLYG